MIFVYQYHWTWNSMDAWTSMIILIVIGVTFQSPRASSLLKDQFYCTSNNCTCSFIHPKGWRVFEPRKLIAVSCKEHGLQTVPDGIPRDTMQLDLSSNTLTNFFSDDIHGLDLLVWLFLHENNLLNVSVKNSKHVTMVFLHKNTISNISNSFKNLTSLGHLGLHDNKITEIPQHFLSEMPVIESLILSSNRLTEIPEDCFPPSGYRLTSLKQLFLDDNRIVNISRNAFKLRGLTHLYLQQNEIENVDQFAFSLPSIVLLNLSRNKILSLDVSSLPLADHGVFTTVDLSSNNISNLLSSHNLTLRIHTLDLSNNMLVILNNTTAKFFHGFPDLKALNLSRNVITNISKHVFKQVDLESLDISFNLLIQVPSFVVSSVKSLKMLNLSNNQIQSVDESSFMSLRPVRHLSLANNEISHIDPMVFNFLLSLKHLDLRNKSFICDCSLYGFSTWLRLYHDNILVTGAVCKSPEIWKGTDIRSLNMVHLCLQEFSLAVATIIFIVTMIYLNRKSLQNIARDLRTRLSAIFQETSVGQIILLPKVLGRGSYGTEVCEGKLKHDGRKVAVKRSVTGEISENEVNTLIELSKERYSQNVVRYYLCEKDSYYTYIGLELCECTLKDFLRGQLGDPDFVLAHKEILKEIAYGLDFLHGHNIIHRDIKPENVLISYPMANGMRRTMLSDLGLARQLSRSFFQTNELCGTIGWMAPEMMNRSAKKTPKLDIFSAGCTFFFVLTKGMHPFGDPAKPKVCQDNIADENFAVTLDILAAVDNVDKNEEILLNDLISLMIHRDQKERRNAAEVMDHPYFWSASNTLDFFHEVSNFCKTKDEEKLPATQAFLERLEENAAVVIGGDGDWLLRFDKKLRSDVGWLKKHRKEVYGIVMTIRNKAEHYEEFSSERKSWYGEYPEGFLCYFTSRFPRLVLETYKAYNQCLTQTRATNTVVPSLE